MIIFSFTYVILRNLYYYFFPYQLYIYTILNYMKKKKKQLSHTLILFQ